MNNSQLLKRIKCQIVGHPYIDDYFYDTIATPEYPYFYKLEHKIYKYSICEYCDLWFFDTLKDERTP